MKIEIINKKEVDYPCLMKIKGGRPGAGTLVLFVKEGVGTVISSNDYSTGETHSDWNPGAFEKFNGEVVLRND